MAILGILLLAALSACALALFIPRLVAVAQSPFAASGIWLYALTVLLLVTGVISYIPRGVHSLSGRGVPPAVLTSVRLFYLAFSLVVVVGTAAWFFLAPIDPLPSDASFLFWFNLIGGAIFSAVGLREMGRVVRYYRQSRGVIQ
jgi:hypothetical protein